MAMYMKKFLYFWWFPPSAGKDYPMHLFQWYKFGYCILLLVACIGVVSLVRRWTASELMGATLIVAFSVFIATVQSVFFVEGRHRLAVEWTLIVLGGHGLYVLSRLMHSAACRLTGRASASEVKEA